MNSVHAHLRIVDVRSLPALVAMLLLAGCATVQDPTARTSSPPTAVPTGAATPAPSMVESRGELELELVAEGLNLPTAMTDLGDGRLLVAEQAGLIRVIEDGALSPEPFLDLSDRVLAEGERGLLGIAAHPDYGTDPRLFATYSNLEGHTELREFTPDGDRLLLMVPQYSVWHKAGNLQFGPDGYLYASIGDDHRTDTARADPREIYGTIIRIDVEVGDGRYGIPADNPFAVEGGRAEVWDYGLRNPWRFGFDSETGDLYIGDVGLDQAEEINLHAADVAGGLDFGWTATEGLACRADECDLDGITYPVHAYDHKDGDCGAIGGHVIRTDHALEGRYVFGDLCSGRIWSFPADDPTNVRVEVESELRISSFGIDSAGEVYVLVHWGNGRIYRLAG